MSKTLKFELSLENANLIMKHLGNAPFVEVADLIAKLRAQAANTPPTLWQGINP